MGNSPRDSLDPAHTTHYTVQTLRVHLSQVHHWLVRNPRLRQPAIWLLHGVQLVVVLFDLSHAPTAIQTTTRRDGSTHLSGANNHGQLVGVGVTDLHHLLIFGQLPSTVRHTPSSNAAVATNPTTLGRSGDS